MTDPDLPLDPEDSALAERLDAQRPRPSHGLRRRVRAVVMSGLRARALRRQSVLLIASGTATLVAAGVLAVTAPI